VSKLVDAIKNLIVGLITTGKHLPRKHVTLQYPTERWTMPERSRGIVVLLSDQETGELNCTTCLLCERACPSAAIKIVYEKDEKNKRFLKDFIVDNTLCCFCGLCEEACNFSAIKLAGKYEFSTTNKEDLIWHTDKLQEIGRDVPYEKKERKKPAPKPAAPKSGIEKPTDEAAKPVNPEISGEDIKKAGEEK
jgi:NADH-quinone oxidoreductase chain I